MKNVRRTGILLVIISLTFIAGCFENRENDQVKILGTWKWIGENEENTFIFYENQSFYSYYVYLPSNEEHKGWGTFHFNDSKLCMHTPHGASGSEENYCYRYIFSENNKKLMLSMENGREIVLIKIA